MFHTNTIYWTHCLFKSFVQHFFKNFLIFKKINLKKHNALSDLTLTLNSLVPPSALRI